MLQSYGAKMRYGAHAHVTYQAPINVLHSPTLLPFLRNSTEYLMLAQSWKFGVKCCSIGLTHPTACTRARASDFWTCPQTPPLTQFAQRGCQSTGFELRILVIHLKFVGVAQYILGGGPKKL